MKKLSFVIPCYRSANSVGDVIKRIEDTVEADARYDYEIICVNDYPADNTIDVLKAISAKDSRVRVVGLSRNFGQHSALMAGFHCVSGDIVVTLDDDGQNPPEELFKLVDKIEEGYDLVSARYEEKKHGFVRRVGSKMALSMSSYLAGKPKDIDLNSYCAFRRFVSDEVIKYTNAYPFVHGLMLRVTRNIANVEISHHERELGQSGYDMKKLVGLFMNGFTAFSEKPLRLASVLGVLCASGSLVFGVVVAIRKIIDPSIAAGYSSLLATVLFMSGVLMILVGLLGEYIGRIYICLNNAPQFVVRETYNFGSED